MRVLIIGAVSGNGGDAAILHAQVQAIGHAAGDLPVAVDVVDSNPEVARRLEPGLDRVLGLKQPTPPARPRNQVERTAVRIRRRVQRLVRRKAPAGPWALTVPRPEVLDLYADADVVLYTGGTSLVEHYSLNEKLAHMEMALVSGTPLVLGTQSLGPFDRPEHQEAMRRITSRAAAVLLRDEASRQNLVEIGADTSKAVVLPDVVFSLADPQTVRTGGERLRVAVSTRAWAYFKKSSARDGQEAYHEAIRGAVVHLVRDRGASVTFVSTCQGVPEYWIDDSATAVAIADGLPPDVAAHVEVRRDNVPPADLQELYATFDAVLATRMHAAILALNAGTPVVAVAYEFKTLELFRGLGMPELAHDIEGVSAQALVGSLNAVLADPEGRRRAVAELVTAVRSGAMELGARVVAAATTSQP